MADKDLRLCRSGALRLHRSIECTAWTRSRHRALWVQKAKIVTGNPIPAQNNIQTRAQGKRGHVDELAQGRVRAQGEVYGNRWGQCALSIGRR